MNNNYEDKTLEKSIIIIDLKAFYASVECVDRNLNPFLTPLVVVDKSRGPGTIILSVTPFLKVKGISSRLRLFELPAGQYVYAKPRMKRYIEINIEIINLILKYIGFDDIHIYSIDEFFINASPYLKLYNTNDIGLAKFLLDKIYTNFSLTACAGIGPNMFLAKCALDLEAKNNKTNIARWDEKDIETKLHKIKPLSKMWSISTHLEKRLNNLGLFSVGDIAYCPLNILQDKLGVIGEELYYLSHGIDLSDIREKYEPQNNSLTVGQTLDRDYFKSDLEVLIREMIDELCARLRLKRQFTRVIKFYLKYSKSIKLKAIHKQCTLDYGSDDEEIIFNACSSFIALIKDNIPIRKISISLSNLYNPTYEQLDLLESPNIQNKNKQLAITIDKIKSKYGKDAISRLDALSTSSTIKKRNKLIGGHHK